ncbi:MAG: transcription antitermination protein NusB [Alistipes sp.]|nr:transcription antitermination protein NusB [Alistipes sp.]MBQ5394215.1 transcription antitermination protein NusB [Alistipes sp.]MBQ5878734.1 transcription antitermination protein NusB [Alistipes sp.]MBR0330708.1 transcription antitermination protein NusB [Alistipes sp.]
MLSRRLLRIKVLKALFAHLKSESDNMIASEKNLVATVDKAYDLYFQLLTLPEQLVKYAQERIDIAKQKKLPTFEDLHPNTKFVDNAVIRIISTTDAVADHVAKRKLGWTGQEDLIRLIYQQLIETEFFKTYMARDNRSWEEDRALVDYLFTMLNDCPVLDEALEEMSLMWADDLPYILAMIQRTISNMRISHTQLRVAEKYKSEEDPQFLKTLFEKALVNYNDYQSYVERFTANWDIERVVFMDNLILGVAIAELVAFPSIPVKVTMDEWIEISKYYSTPGSSTFINGVLDKIVALLTEEGKIQKSGRGLI